MLRLLLSLPILLTACGAPADDGSKAKLANELVTCKNENLTLKEQLADVIRTKSRDDRDVGSGDSVLHP